MTTANWPGAPTETYGLLAEFETPEQLLDATRAAHAEGYRAMDALSPFPVEDLYAALGRRPSRLPWAVLAGAIVGGGGGFLMQYYTAVFSYPFNIGGRPLNSWPHFLIITFELAILAAALTAVVYMVAANRLPRPYHPLFNVDAFDRVTRDRFYLCIEAADPRFDREATRRFLETLHPISIHEVPQ